MHMRGEIEDRAEFYWKRAAAVRARADGLTTPAARDTLRQVADDYERLAEALMREALLGDEAACERSGAITSH